ncbi:rac GTPase-activating protein 1-like [Gigantopelta aegis]|uniref:rac GTPase-activating protein 1-like n=1 Tax=Gigantopelta aegis TaxID=1735272 RepID=UPI001B88B9D3|nr:rac GTPase-activating protein 1-like [Gigantopelta aegis]
MRRIQSNHKLSRVAMYDDLLRTARVLRESCEPEFRTFVRNQSLCRKKWNAAESKVESLHDQVKQLQAEKAALHTRLKHSCTTVDTEMHKRKQVEYEREMLDRQLALIRDLLNDRNNCTIQMNERDRERFSALINTTQTKSNYEQDSPSKRLNTIMESSASILSDVDYDPSEGDIDISCLNGGRRRYSKRHSPSAPPMEDDYGRYSPKRHRVDDDDHDNSIITTTTITVNEHGNPVSATTEVSVPKLNRSFSEPALDKHFNPALVNDRDADSEPESDESYLGTPRNRNNSRMRSQRGILKKSNTPTLGRSSSAGNGLNRVHVFMSKSVMIPETCIPCGQRIRFGKMAMKCKDCRSVCHVECKDNLPLPCIPSCPNTPGNKSAKISGGLISDYTPSDPPYIPGLVVHCVNEIESRGLDEVGIYRVPGSDKEVKELKEKFLKKKGTPNLANISDIHVVCSCLKDFLRSLKEPLITYGLWREFVNAAERQNQQEAIDLICKAVIKLPVANRDTLAFLILHLQRVAESPKCKMPGGNLANIFGPTIVGYSSAEQNPKTDLFMETRKQKMVMDLLLSVSTDYWVQFIEVENISLYPAIEPSTARTPDTVPRSRLGPVLTPGSYENQTMHMQSRTQNSCTPTLPNRTSRNTSRNPRHFFASPFVT